MGQTFTGDSGAVGLSEKVMPGNTLTWLITLDPTRRGQEVCSVREGTVGMGLGSERLKCFKEPVRTEGRGLSSLRTRTLFTTCIGQIFGGKQREPTESALEQSAVCHGRCTTGTWSTHT